MNIYFNKEVRDSMLEILIEAFVGVDAELSTSLIIRIRNAFRANDLELVIRILQGVFKELPYFLHEKYPEKFFHAAWEKGKKVIGFGVNFSSKSRNIEEWVAEELG